MLNRRTLVAGLAAFFIAPSVQAEAPVFYAESGAAMSGYDVVSYFTSGGPELGQPEIAVMWKGAAWHFASHANREAFEANPRAYAPQFGGYCAYAIAQGHIVSTDPTAWRVVDGKLYLTHSKQIEQMWLRDVPGFIARAEGNWPAVLYD